MQKTLFILLSLLVFKAFAQEDRTTELFMTLQKKDSLLFNVGYNTCNIKVFEDLLSENFEFYHDEAGITNTKADFIEGVNNGLCKLSYQPRRELDRESLNVYPLKKNGMVYGAIQTGRHRFYAIEKNKATRLTSIAQFTNVWILENGQWKLSRSLSFDHEKKD